MTQRPRHSRKEVRQVADWLIDNGWTFTDFDGDGHAIYLWPTTGQTIKLPETPRGHLWLQRTRADAQKIMGHTFHKYDPRTARARQSRRAKADLAEIQAQRRRIDAQRDREQTAADHVTARANAQLAAVATDLGCTPAQAPRRLRELQSIAHLMGAGRI